MISNDLNQNLIRVVSGQNQNASLSKLGEKLALDQILKGQVLEVFPKGKALINFHGQKLLIESEVSLNKGQEILIKVNQLKPNLTLKLMPPKPTTSPIIGKRQASLGEALTVSTFQFKGLNATALKPYLIANQEFGTMISNLESDLIKNPILNEIKIDTQVIEQLKETLRVLLPKDKALPNEVRLKEQVDRSGINYEGKVKRILFQELTPESRVTLARDLKGQLLELQGRVEKFLIKDSPDFNSNSFKVIENFNNQLKLAANNIELQQLSNQFARQEHQPLLIQFPDPFSPETRTAKLYIKRDEGEGSRSKEDKKDFNLVFLLDMSTLGGLRIDTRVGENYINAKIGVKHDSVADFVKKNLPQLKDQLQEIGYRADLTCCIQEKDAMRFGNRLEEMLTRDPTRLIDIET